MMAMGYGRLILGLNVAPSLLALSEANVPAVAGLQPGVPVPYA